MNSALTGEPLPVERASGEVARSGAVNAAAPFDMIAATDAASSTFAGIVRLVDAAQRAKAPSARLADRYALLFVPLAIAVAGGAWIATGDPIRALAVLVVATPCPLILAVPVAIVAGISRCAKRGVLIKGGGMLEKLAQAKTLFFDKTGTLTGGRARLVGIEAAPELDAGELLGIAASLDQVSQHVIAQAIVTAARDRRLALSMPSGVEEQPGAGLTGMVGNRRVAVGSYAFVCASAAPADWSHRFLQRMGYDGATGVFVAIDGVMAGALLLHDEIRAETPRALRLLRKAGVERIVMVTGNRRDVAETIGALLGVDEVLAEQKPQDKLAAIEASRSAGSTIMVGDGVNDAPALAAADVGVAMGARGTAASSEAAGVVLLVDRLDRLAEALRISHRARAIAVQSVVAGMGLSFIAMAAAALGYLPPLAGAVLQEAINVAVILNALRALHVHGPREGREPLTQAQFSALKKEHDELGPVLERVRSTADRLAIVPRGAIAAELSDLNELLREKLLPHERQDDAQVYPAMARLIGGDDPLAAMSRMHREIHHLARLLSRMTKDLPPGGPDPGSLADIQRKSFTVLTQFSDYTSPKRTKSTTLWPKPLEERFRLSWSVQNPMALFSAGSLVASNLAGLRQKKGMQNEILCRRHHGCDIAPGACRTHAGPSCPRPRGDRVARVGLPSAHCTPRSCSRAIHRAHSSRSARGSAFAPRNARRPRGIRTHSRRPYELRRSPRRCG